MKNFDHWNELKKNTQQISTESIMFYEREIWWCTLGLNIGSEQDGIGENYERPVVIIKKLSPYTFLCAPLSTKKKLDKFQALVTTHKAGYALLDQVRTCDSKRLLRKLETMKESEYVEMLEKLDKILGIKKG